MINNFRNIAKLIFGTFEVPPDCLLTSVSRCRETKKNFWIDRRASVLLKGLSIAKAWLIVEPARNHPSQSIL